MIKLWLIYGVTTGLVRCLAGRNCSPSLPVKKQLDGFHAGTECYKRRAKREDGGATFHYTGCLIGIFIFNEYTLQGTSISHLGKRNIIFKMPFLGDMLVSWRVIYETAWHTNTLYVGIQNLRLRSSSSLRRLRIVIQASKEITIPAKISYGSWTHRIHGTGILGY